VRRRGEEGSQGGTQKTAGGHCGGVPLPSDQTDQGRGGEELHQDRGGDQDGRGNRPEKRTLRKMMKKVREGGILFIILLYLLLL
jgi:hypothetical protein